MNKTVLVVDDHPLFRKALVGLVEESPACASVVAAASAEEGLQRLRENKVDLILLDLGLPGAAGVDAISLFRRACNANIVVVSASEHRQEISAATRAGASAVVSKSVSMETLKDIVHRALTDTLPEQKWIRPVGSLTLGDDIGRGLTVRQQEIAALLMDGHSNKEIGMRLNLAEITVKTHLTAIFRLLNVVNRTQAVVAIRRLGIDYGAGPANASHDAHAA
ncbi:MAG: response regulator transcription factor [Ramlibacter sp.]|nr:response regulator transcription factor [Ramlibacter sp.]